MSLYDKLKFAIAENSHDANTLSSYWHADAARGFSPMDVAMAQPLPTVSVAAPRAALLT